MTKINDGGPELKHCPFCGPNVRKPVLHKDKGVKCHTCGAWGPAWEKPDGSEWNRRADLVSEPCVSIPEGHPDLNLAAWLERRREQIGPWADYIIAEVGKLEREVANLRSAAPDWQTIATVPVGIPVLAYCYGEEVLLTRITKHGEDEYARNPDLWMPVPKPPTKEQTHD